MLSGAVCCVFLLAIAVGSDQVRASGTTRGLPTDDKVAIVLKPSAFVFGGCPKFPASTMNVRLHTLKTKSGAIFRRKDVTDDKLACLENLCPQSLAASSFQKCFEQTEAAGLKMFRWDGGQCTGYTNGIPQNLALCDGAGSMVLYSMDVQAINPVRVVSNITIALSGNITIDAAWDVKPPSSCFPVLYRVSFNNHDTFVSDKLATVGLATALPCAEHPLTVTPLDANSVVAGPAVTVMVVIPKALELFLNLTHGVTAVKASWRAEYTCNPQKTPSADEPIASYSVKLGTQEETTDNSTFEFFFNPVSGRCSDTASTLTADLNAVDLVAYNGAGTRLQEVTVTLTNNIMPGHRYLSDAGNCFYYQTLGETPGGVGLTYDQLLDFCVKTMHSGLYADQEPLQTYNNELMVLRQQTPSVDVGPHYMGVKRNSTIDSWVWESGQIFSVLSLYWDIGEPALPGDCAELKVYGMLCPISCDATSMATVCFDALA